MARKLTSLLTSLLDTTGSLGVGVVDGNGLLVQGCGLHGEQPAEKVAAYLGCQARSGAQLLNDTLVESSLVGQRYCFYLQWPTPKPYFVYVMTDATQKSAARSELRRYGAELSALLTASGGPVRQGLEQPRQFGSSRGVR